MASRSTTRRDRAMTGTDTLRPDRGLRRQSSRFGCDGRVANRWRGETLLRLANRCVVLRPTFAALAEMEQHSGRGILDLATRTATARSRGRDLAAIILVAARAAGTEVAWHELVAAPIRRLYPVLAEFLVDALVPPASRNRTQGGSTDAARSAEGPEGNAPAPARRRTNSSGRRFSKWPWGSSAGRHGCSGRPRRTSSGRHSPAGAAPMGWTEIGRLGPGSRRNRCGRQPPRRPLPSARSASWRAVA